MKIGQVYENNDWIFTILDIRETGHKDWPYNYVYLCTSKKYDLEYVRVCNLFSRHLSKTKSKLIGEL